MLQSVRKFLKIDKTQLSVIPGYYEQLMYQYCKLGNSIEVSKLLNDVGGELDLLYQDGLFFTSAIHNENADILSVLLNHLKNTPIAYNKIKDILHSIDTSYISLKVQNILSEHQIVYRKEDDLLNDISVGFKFFCTPYQSENIILSKDDASNIIMILPLTEYNLHTISTSEYWQKASESYYTGKSFKNALDVINDWNDTISSSRFPKAMILYHYLVETKNLLYIEGVINHDLLMKIYLTEVSSIALILGDENIPALINGYYLHKDEIDDSSYVESSISSQQDQVTLCGNENSSDDTL